jgi:transketolase
LTELILADAKPTYLRLDKDVSPTRRDVRCTAEGWRVLRGGSDVAIVAHGGIRREAEAAAELLQKEDISASVISAPVLSLFDRQQVESCISSQRLIVSVEEHSVSGGLGSILAELIAESGSGQKLVRMGLQRFSHEVGTQQYLRDVHHLSVDHISGTIREALGTL